MRPGAPQCTDLCAINATIILLAEAFSAGTLPNLIDGILACIRPSLASSSTEAPAVDMTVAPRDLAEGLGNAMDWWRRYYEHQQYERKFMEHQTGLPFSHWEAAVARIRAEVPDMLVQREAGLSLGGSSNGEERAASGV